MRKLALISLVVGLTLAFASAGSQGSTNLHRAKPPVRFAVVSIGLPGVPLLDDYKTGAQAAADQINAAGGFGGRRVVLDFCNSLSQSAAATACAHTTLGNHPIAEFGCDTFWGNSGLLLYAAAKTPSFNCMNLNSNDFNNPYSFGVNPAGIGEWRASARFACSKPSIHSWMGLSPDLPAFHADVALGAQIITACGKQVLPAVYYPLTAADVSPYVNKVVQQNPDFITFFAIGAQPVLFFRGFQQNNFSVAGRIGITTAALVYDTVVKPAGSSANGVYALGEFDTPSDTKNPEVRKYLAAFKSSPTTALNATVENGYAYINWFYTVAKAIGFDKFNNQTLAKFMSTKNGVHIPLSRTLFNPGPKKFPQQKQPYVQITQLNNGKFTIVPTGAKKDGWVYGY